MIIHSTAELAEFIRDCRKTRNISQADVGDRVGLRQETISSFENKPGSTKLATLFKLLSALDLELCVVRKGELKGTQGWDQEW
jgi:HTH-type transcriptional regulator / antitoxin HipB